MSYTPPAKSSRKPVIFVVEDQNIFCNALKLALPNERIIISQTVEEAKELYRLNMPEIIFLDINLPDGSGYEVLEYIQTITPKAFIVMLTSSSSSEDVRKSIERGAKGYILKPFSKERVQQYVKQYMSEYQEDLQEVTAETHTLPREAVLKNTAKIPPTPKEEEAEKHFKKLMKNNPILFVDAYETNIHNVELTLKERGYQVDSAHDAEEALALIKEHNYPIVIIDCESPQIGGYTLSAAIRQLDRGSKKPRIIIGLGADSETDYKKWMAAGMNDYYLKPFPIKTLVSVLFKFIRTLSEDYTQ